MKIIFMGTPDFAVESLRKIHSSRAELAAVVTAPDRPAGRGKKLKSSAVKNFAIENRIPVLQPTNLKDPEFIKEIQEINADLFVVVAFRMLPEIVWSMPKKGTINLHASLLPNYRGAAPINWAIINGEKETGITTFFIEKEIDTGKIIHQQKVAILEGDTVGILHDKLMIKGADLLLKTISSIEDGTNPFIDQQNLISNKLNNAPKINKQTGKIQWNNSKSSINNLIRGLSPYPGAWTKIEIDAKSLIFKIYSAKCIEGQLHPGEISVNNNELHIGCSDGCLKLAEIQLEGKKRMSAEEFIKGARFTNNQCL